VLNGLPMNGVLEDGDKTLLDAPIIRWKHVAQPIECLDKPHGRTASPVEAAGRGVLEVESQLAECDGPQATIGQHGDARRNGVGQAEVIGGSDSVDYYPDVSLPGQGVDHIARVGISRFSRETVGLRGIVEAASDPPKVLRSNQTVKSLIDRGTRSKIGKVVRRPDLRLRRGGDAVPDGGWDAGWLVGQWASWIS
jgi:hypothetical protein